MDRFVFDYHHDTWTWTCVDPRGKTVSRCARTFAYYLECVADAKLHGFEGKPYFMSPQGDLVSPSFSRH